MPERSVARWSVARPLGALIKTGRAEYRTWNFHTVHTFAKTLATLELHSQAGVCAVGQEGIIAPCRQTMNGTPNLRRRLETEARSVAASLTNPEARRVMHFIAEGYKLLADRAEFRKTQKD
jgi:L,D-peptidoglycan transpeptidase YkuD (ErfK/YbiS/YcfS/YnhG family)